MATIRIPSHEVGIPGIALMCYLSNVGGVLLGLFEHRDLLNTSLERQMNSGVFERVMIGNQKLPAAMREFELDVSNTFKNSYVFEFLNLPELHNERQLQFRAGAILLMS